jgi:hypothetical protein
VFNLLGQEVAMLVNEVKKPGGYELMFDGTRLPSGVFFYELRSGTQFQRKKMILLK